MATLEFEHSMPFGKHAGKPLPDVPTDYLEWALKETKLGSGLRAAVVAELGQRGVAVPAAQPGPPPACRRCGDAGQVLTWERDRNGQAREAELLPLLGGAGG
jgi:hypothetical protein